MTISKRDIQLLIGFAGILLVILTYFFFYTKLQEKTELLKADNQILAEEVGKLESLNLQKDIFLKKMEEYNVETKRIQEGYDVGYLTEDDIMYIVNMENTSSNQLAVPYLNMSGPSAVALPATTIVGEMGMLPVDNGVLLYQAPMNFGMEITYDGFKNMINYIYATGGTKNVESVSLMFNTSTGQLSGTMVLNRYFISNTDRIYQPYEIPNMRIGTDNLFKTTDAAIN